MKDFIVDEEATEEFEQDVAFYEDRRPGLGEDFREAVIAAIEKVCLTPSVFSPYRSKYRKYVLKRFPYAIYFRDYPGHVWIAAIAHTSRRPDYWLGRDDQP